MFRNRLATHLFRSQIAGLLFALLLVIGLLPAPSVSARQAHDDAPLDLAAMVLRPSDLDAEGVGPAGDTRYFNESLDRWSTLSTGHIVIAEAVEHSAAARLPDALIGPLYRNLAEAGWRQQFRALLSGASETAPLFVSTVGEYADEEGAEAAFSLLTAIDAVPGADELDDVAEIGDQSAAHRDVSDLVVPDGHRITLIFRYDTLVGVVQVYETEPVELDVLDALAGRMIQRIEAVLAGESGGFAHLVLNLDLSLSPAFERYEVLDGDVMFLFDDTEADREERLASWAPRANAYRINQPIPQNGREMQDVPLFGVHLIQFDDEDAAIDYFEQYTGDRPTEPIDDASSFGDETLTFEHEYDWSGVERTELRIVTRIADTVIHLTLDGPEAAPDLADAEALMAIQVECLAAGACLERQPIPPSLLDLVCAGEAADAGEQPLGHDVEGDAPMAGADPAQTGEQAGPGPDGDPELLWRFDTAGDFHTAPVVADGLVFAGSGGSESGQDGTFYALDAATGERAWCIPTGGFHPNTSAAADGLIVSPEIDPRVQRGTGAAIVARIANTGEELWRVPTGGSAADLLIADRTVFVVTVDTLSALDLETGAYRWHVTLESSGEDAAFTGLAIADGLVYAGYFLGFEQPYGIYALDAESGNERWTYEQENFMEEGTWLTGGPVVAGGMVFAGNSFGGFSALDATSGEVVWTFVPSIESWEGAEHDGMNFNAPAVVDGVVYVGTGSSQGDHDDDRFLYALDAETGEERWAHEADTPILMQPAIVDGVAYVGDISGTLLAIDTESGDLIWDYHLDGELGRDGLAVVDGVIYLATRDGSLYAITGENRQGL